MKYLITILLIMSLINCGPNEPSDSKVDSQKTKVKKSALKQKNCKSITGFMKKLQIGKPLLRYAEKVISESNYNEFVNKYKNIYGAYNQKKVNEIEACVLFEKLYKKIDENIEIIDKSLALGIVPNQCDDNKSSFDKVWSRAFKITSGMNNILPYDQYINFMSRFNSTVENYRDEQVNMQLTCVTMNTLSQEMDHAMLATRADYKKLNKGIK